MQTDDLIARLSSDLAPAPRHWAGRWLALGGIAGLAGGVALWLLLFGPRPDLPDAILTGAFWIKLLYTAALSGAGLWLLARAGRPGAALSPPAFASMVPVALLGVAAILALLEPETTFARLALGQSLASCFIALLSLPALAAAFWALRHLAPTRLAQAGAGAGFFAGSEGALLYSFSGTEDGAPFVAVWYTFGILLTATLGAFLGRSLLRW